MKALRARSRHDDSSRIKGVYLRGMNGDGGVMGVALLEELRQRRRFPNRAVKLSSLTTRPILRGAILPGGR